jgi:hypothetical protein
MASLQKYLTEFKDNVTEELNNQSDMLTDITNNLQVNSFFTLGKPVLGIRIQIRMFFRPPGSASGSVSHKYGVPSIIKQK